MDRKKRIWTTYSGLPAHSYVLISFDLWLLDGWTSGKRVDISVDSDLNQVTNINNVATTNICGRAANDHGKFDVKLVLSHSASTLAFDFNSNLNTGDNKMIYGIRNINILFS